VAGFVIVGKFAGAAKEMAVAWRYGISEVMDAYQLATTLVFWLPGALVSVLTVVLVPMLVRLRQESGEARALFLGELHGSILLVGAGLGGLSLVLGALALPIITGNLSAESRQMAWQLTLGMAPLAPLALMIGVYAARLMARERQINTLLEGVPAAVLLPFVLFWPPSAEIAPLLWGTVLGIAIHAAWLWRLARRADGEIAALRFSRNSQHWPELYKAAGVMAGGQFVMSFITPLDQYTAAQLGDSAIATLGYANRVIALLIGVGAIAISRATLPVMADLHADGSASRLHNIALKWAALMLAAGTLVAAVAWALAPWGIGLLFERGAFSSQDTQGVTEVFRWGLIQIPFYYSGLVLVQFLASQGRYQTIALFAVSNLVVKFVLNATLAAWLGVAGIAFATSLMYFWSVACLYWAALQQEASW
jgi:peptidoglycan biosynthesis protein MviN/MurJ (putative lipid II flippase)